MARGRIQAADRHLRHRPIRFPDRQVRLREGLAHRRRLQPGRAQGRAGSRPGSRPGARSRRRHPGLRFRGLREPRRGRRHRHSNGRAEAEFRRVPAPAQRWAERGLSWGPVLPALWNRPGCREADRRARQEKRGDLHRLRNLGHVSYLVGNSGSGSVYRDQIDLHHQSHRSARADRISGRSQGVLPQRTGGEVLREEDRSEPGCWGPLQDGPRARADCAGLHRHRDDGHYGASSLR